MKAATKANTDEIKAEQFQSTPPVKAATLPGDVVGLPVRFQSTPPVKAATFCVDIINYALIFQSTPPVKAATSGASCPIWLYGISIHAAREGGDRKKAMSKTITMISIHAAREGGDGFCAAVADGFILFQSTPPVKAATFVYAAADVEEVISIHAAREGGDPLL